jgi:diadenosine tetraphosphate (Ap4A) HIT family hydrolase
MSDTGSRPLCQVAVRGEGILFETDKWLVRSISSTPAVAGWLILQAKRHSVDPADFDAAEAATFGPMMQRIAHLLREITGAVRIYIGSLNEGVPHFHCHRLPRLPVMPNNALGWSAFGLSEAARRGEVRADPEEVERVLAALRERSTSSV